MKNDAIIAMINGDNNNSFQSVIQVLLGIEIITKCFMMNNDENGEMF